MDSPTSRAQLTCHQERENDPPSYEWYDKDINQPSLPTPVYSVLVSILVFMAHSAVFHSINSPDSSLLSRSVLPL